MLVSLWNVWRNNHMIRNDGNAMMKIAHWRLEWDGWAVKRFGRSYKGEKNEEYDWSIQSSNGILLKDITTYDDSWSRTAFITK
mmetsp:Transcript_6052/g.9597  ORF Transcript_6052/g.9597 Transcript_6052/m.9597 type:complete len:83 (-) Transcript_6052:327-575(-)